LPVTKMQKVVAAGYKNHSQRRHPLPMTSTMVMAHQVDQPK